MNLILGLLLGAVMGWVAFTLLRLNAKQGLRASLFIGVIGGGIGMQLAPMVRTTPGVDGQLNVFALVIAAAVASACLIIASMLASRRGG